MAEHNGPEFDVYSGSLQPRPWYLRIFERANDRVFAIGGVLALNWIAKTESVAFDIACLVTVAVLGIASAMIRKRE